MPCYSLEGVIPVVDPTAYVHPSAVLIGDVTLPQGTELVTDAEILVASVALPRVQEEPEDEESTESTEAGEGSADEE